MDKVVFIADMFAEDYGGGAEQALEALIESCPADTVHIRSKELTSDVIRERIAGRFVVFGNVAEVRDFRLLDEIAQACRFVIVEFDFKLSQSRNPTLHEYRTGKKDNVSNPNLVRFFEAAECVFFMSERQAEWTKQRANLKKSEILSSTFTKDQIAKMDEIRNSDPFMRAANVIVHSRNELKGVRQSIRHAHDKDLEYKLLCDLGWEDLLSEFRSAEALIFLPLGEDTCPRITIEARLMGCKLIINDNVLHHREIWFENSDIPGLLEYLKGRPAFFWGKVNELERHMDDAGRGAGRECVGV